MSHKADPCPTPEYGDSFVLILVLFILLVIIGAAYLY
ncbi:YjcZ family sporulation protein [Evansella halocellulosilytica]|nr:YjcZ family sporulation protein [Evansella halocellulosilytica]